MLYLLRHLLSVMALPFVVVVVVPAWICRRYHVLPSWPSTAVGWFVAAAGVAALAGGFLLFVASLANFFSNGRGTLAPWDPPRRLVVSGPYRFVRNPMISGVLFMLFGIALTLRSGPHALWAALFLVVNLIYLPVFEEAALEDRFGDEYRRYRAHVPRFVPRFMPWNARTARPRGDGAGRRGPR